MSDIPKDLLYTEDHEYVKPTDDPNVVAIGITDYAQGELGDIVFIELPKVGATFAKHDVFGTVEAVKAVSSSTRRSAARSSPSTIASTRNRHSSTPRRTATAG